MRDFKAKKLMKSIFISLFAVPILVLIFSVNTYSQVKIGATNYSTLFDACNAINSGIHTGNIIIQITGNVTETAIAQLNSGSGSPANYSSVTIKPTDSYKISAAHGGTILYLNGANNVTIDGSKYSGGTSKDLTFQNDAASSTIPNSNTILNSTTYGGCILAMNGSNIIVKNTQLTSNSQSAGWGVNFYTITNGTIDNCIITRSSLGVLAQLSTNINITNSVIGSTTSSDNIGFRGICFYGVDTFIIRQNEILGITYTQTTAAASARGITIHTNSSGGLGTSKNGIVDKNKVHYLRNSVSGAYGIVLQGAVSTDDFNTIISNNMIYDIVNTSNFSSGIVLTGAGTNTKIYHNTINLYVPSGSTNSGQSYSVYILQTNIDFRNNIIYNQTTSSGGSDIGIVVSNAAGVSTFSYIDYNTWVLTGTGTRNLAIWSSTYSADATGLTAWQTLVGGETHSTITTTPVLVADDNPHLNGSSLTDPNMLCIPIPPSGNWDGKDFDGEIRRSGTNPVTFRGADEVYPSNISITQNIASSPNQNMYCEGSNVSLSFTATISSFKDGITRSSISPVYSWYKSTGTPKLINGQTNSTLSFSPIRQADSANYFAYAKFVTDSVVSNTQLLTVQNAISISVHPQDRALCSTIPNLQLSVTALGTVTNYQWQKETPTGSGNYQNIAGQNKALMSIAVTDAAQASGKYRVIVYGNSCGLPSITSNPATVTVADPLNSPSITVNTDPGLVCTGSNLTLTANVASGTVIGYQWQRNDGIGWQNVDLEKFPTAKQQTLVINNILSTESSKYQCIITGSSYCPPTQVTTNTVIVKVQDLFQITHHPKDMEVCLGETVALSCSSIGIVHSYQWQKDGVDIKLSDNATAQNSLLSIHDSKYEQSGTYRCKLNIEDCRGILTIYSDNAIVHISTPTFITVQPENQIIPLGSVATFQFTAQVNGKKIEDAIINQEVKVQWYKYESDTKSTALVDNMPRIAGSKSNYLTINNFTKSDLGKYWAQIIGLCGTVKTVNAELIQEALDLTIVKQPEAVAVCEGTDAVLSVDATTPSAKTINYQWFKGTTPVVNVNGVTDGAKSKQLTIFGVKASDADSYYAQVTLDNTSVMKQSDKVNLTVNTKPEIKTQPENASIQSGAQLSLEVVLVNSTETGLIYQWYMNGKIIQGANTSNYLKAKVDANDAGEYWCEITNNCGTVNSSKVSVTVTTTQTDVTDVQSGGYSISASVPSPVNNVANVRYFVPALSNVKISLSDIQGSFDTELVNQMISAGEHFLTINVNQLNISSGTYFMKLESNGILLVQKIVVIK